MSLRIPETETAIEERRQIESEHFDLFKLVLRNASMRKCRLLIGECCRRIGQGQLGDLCEGVAEGRADAEELLIERHRPWLARIAWLTRQFNPTRVPPTDQTREFVWHALNHDSRSAVTDMIDIAPPEMQGTLRGLIRDVFGNPQTLFDQRWRTSTVIDLAQAIYDERAFDRLPILADALMDAGCDSDEMILHCRGPGPHVKGCWVVDLILGKE